MPLATDNRRTCRYTKHILNKFLVFQTLVSQTSEKPLDEEEVCEMPAVRILTVRQKYTKQVKVCMIGAHSTIWGHFFLACFYFSVPQQFWAQAIVSGPRLPVWHRTPSFRRQLGVYPRPQPTLSQHWAIKRWCGEKCIMRANSQQKGSMFVCHHWKLLKSGDSDSET